MKVLVIGASGLSYSTPAELFKAQDACLWCLGISQSQVSKEAYHTITCDTLWKRLVTGLLVGTLDAVAAVIQFIIPTPRDPVRIFEYIAGGVFGKDAFSGGPTMAVMVFFHYLIATAWTSLFFTVYPRIPWLGKHKVAGGLLYVVLIWLAMNLVILPLGNPVMSNV